MMSTFKERLIEEQSELDKKICKLKEFIDYNVEFIKLPKEQQYLLHKQFYYMDEYNKILIRRLELLEQKGNE